MVDNEVEQCNYAAKFNFFGLKLELQSVLEEDIARANFIFREFKYEGNEVDITFYLKVKNNINVSFVNSLMMPNGSVEIFYKYTGSNEKKKWQFKDTILPPVQIEPLKGKFLVLHGCGIVNDRNEAIVFPAPSLAGKTSLMVYMVSKGYKCISDDLLFIDTKTLKVYPYPKPVGIRERGLDLIPELEKIVEPYIDKTITFIEPNYGTKTWLIHMDDLYKNCYIEEPIKIDYIVYPDKEKDKNYKLKLNSSDNFIKLLSSLCNSGLTQAESITATSNLISNTKSSYIMSSKFLNNLYNNLEGLKTSSEEK